MLNYFKKWLSFTNNKVDLKNKASELIIYDRKRRNPPMIDY